MTPAVKAKDIVYKKFLPIIPDGEEKVRIQAAKSCAGLFAEEMIKTFERIVQVYSKDFDKSVKFWQDVKAEVLAL